MPYVKLVTFGRAKLKGGPLDFSPLTELKNIYFTEISMQLEALERLYRSTGLIFL